MKKLLALGLLFLLCQPLAHATKQALGYPSGSPITVCVPSDTNTNCGGSSLTVGTTTITGGTNTYLEYNNSGKLGEIPQSTFLLASGATTGATSQAQIFTDGIIPSNLTVGYVPYAESTDKKLVNSPLYTDGTNVGIGTTMSSNSLEIDAPIANGGIYMKDTTYGGTITLQPRGYTLGTPQMIFNSPGGNIIRMVTGSNQANLSYDGTTLSLGNLAGGAGAVGVIQLSGNGAGGGLLSYQGEFKVDTTSSTGWTPLIFTSQPIGTQVVDYFDIGYSTPGDIFKIDNVGNVHTAAFTATSTSIASTFAGNVGIGTTSPGATLEVNGSLKTNLHTGSNAGTPVTMCTDSNGALCKCTQCA